MQPGWLWRGLGPRWVIRRCGCGQKIEALRRARRRECGQWWQHPGSRHLPQRGASDPARGLGQGILRNCRSGPTGPVPTDGVFFLIFVLYVYVCGGIFFLCFFLFSPEAAEDPCAACSPAFVRAVGRSVSAVALAPNSSRNQACCSAENGADGAPVASGVASPPLAITVCPRGGGIHTGVRKRHDARRKGGRREV